MNDSPIYDEAASEGNNPLFEIRYVGGPAEGVYQPIGVVKIGEVYSVSREVAEAAVATGQFVETTEGTEDTEEL